MFVALLASLTSMSWANAATNDSPTTAPDPVFAPGLAKIKQSSPFIEDQPGQTSIEWKPHLQLLVGVKAVEGSKCTVYFVQLTTLPPPETNSLGLAWHPILRTNDWRWSTTNKTQFITTNYPVYARVFDEKGNQLKGGKTPMAWGMLTNGLLDMCRLGLEDQHQEATDHAASNAPPNAELMCAFGGGLLWMFGMFGDLQTVPTVADVWEQAQCAFRWPSAWTLATAPFKGISLGIEPRLQEVTLVDPTTVNHRGPLYCLPLHITSGKRNLTRVEIVVGPAGGAEMLLAGIRSIHAKHPTKAKHEFLAQVLASGVVEK